MNIRRATESDRTAIENIHLSAFGQEEGEQIAGLVTALMGDVTGDPRLSLVAEQDGKLVGHILFTNVTLDPEQPGIAARSLAPLAVRSDDQGQGIGSALIREGLKQLTASNVDLVFVLGDPGYYTRYGFQPAGPFSLHAPYPIPPAHADAWMVQALKPGVLGHIEGTVRCAEALNQPEYW
jgi:predicted N-acetyltransferase YhbS